MDSSLRSETRSDDIEGIVLRYGFFYGPGTWFNPDGDVASPPPQIPVEAAFKTRGADAVYYGTQMRGVSNAKAKRELNFQPRRLEWITDTALAQAS